MKNKIESTVLLTTIIFPISVFIINKILGIFDWHLRYWVWYLAFEIIHIGGYIFSIFAISTMKSKIGKYSVILIWTIICFVIYFINFGIFGWISKFDTIKEIDGKNYIGIENAVDWDAHEFKYYDKYNWFAYKEDKVIIEEFFEHNMENPETRTYHKEDGENQTIYFDEKGNIISKEEYLNRN